MTSRKIGKGEVEQMISRRMKKEKKCQIPQMTNRKNEGREEMSDTTILSLMHRFVPQRRNT